MSSKLTPLSKPLIIITVITLLSAFLVTVIAVSADASKNGRSQSSHVKKPRRPFMWWLLHKKSWKLRVDDPLPKEIKATVGDTVYAHQFLKSNGKPVFNIWKTKNGKMTIAKERFEPPPSKIKYIPVLGLPPAALIGGMATLIVLFPEWEAVIVSAEAVTAAEPGSSLLRADIKINHLRGIKSETWLPTKEISQMSVEFDLVERGGQHRVIEKVKIKDQAASSFSVSGSTSDLHANSEYFVTVRLVSDSSCLDCSLNVDSQLITLPTLLLTN